MKPLLVMIVLAAWLGSPCFAQPAKPDQPKPMRVLFVGNSYTTVNDLPGMLEALAARAKVDRPMVTGRSTRGGWTLQKHWEEENPATQEAIRNGPWDYVVIQEQSQMPFLYPKITHKFGLLLGKLIREQNATPLFYMTWAREHQPENQATIQTTYEGMASELKAPVAPVGVAWERALKEKVAIKLHQKDRSHPTAAGTYLAACVFFARIYDRSPEGLPGKLTKQVNAKTRTLCQIEPAHAKLLQRIAWQAVNSKASPTSP